MHSHDITAMNNKQTSSPGRVLCSFLVSTSPHLECNLQYTACRPRIRSHFFSVLILRWSSLVEVFLIAPFSDNSTFFIHSFDDSEVAHLLMFKFSLLFSVAYNSRMDMKVLTRWKMIAGLWSQWWGNDSEIQTSLEFVKSSPRTIKFLVRSFCETTLSSHLSSNAECSSKLDWFISILYFVTLYVDAPFSSVCSFFTSTIIRTTAGGVGHCALTLLQVVSNALFVFDKTVSCTGHKFNPSRVVIQELFTGTWPNVYP